MEDINKSMRNNMRSLRAKANYTQLEIADLMGITKTTVVNWEQNPTSVSIGKLVQLAKFYNCNLSDFTKDC